MILSTQTFYLSELFGDETAVRMLAEAGYDALDYSMFRITEDSHILNSEGYKEYALNLKRTAEEAGVHFNQAHAPFPSVRYGNDEYNADMFKKIVRSMEVASILGAKIIIVHPFACPKEVDQKGENIAFYNRLLPYCKEYGIKVALENMWGYDERRGCIVPNVCSTGAELAEYVDELDSEWFVACLDVGHSGLIGEEASTAIRVLGKERLKALHIHDNDYKRDCHVIPFVGKMNWEDITKALADIGYEGDFTLEADSFLYGYDKEFISSAVKFMHDTGRYLISRIENAKK